MVLPRLLWRAGRRYVRDGASTYAAALSYNVLFSLFPLLLLLVSVFGLLLRDPALQAQVVAVLVAQIPPEVHLRPQVEAVVEGVARAPGGLVGGVSLLGLAWSASGMFSTLQQALDRVFHVPADRPFLRGALVNLASVLTVALMVLLSLALSTAGHLLGFASWRVPGGVPLVALGGVLGPLVLSLLAFWLVYRFIPNAVLPRRQRWTATLAATVGFEVAKLGFGLYVARFGHFDVVYGALGGVVAFLFFVYVVSAILLFAAELAAAGEGA